MHCCNGTCPVLLSCLFFFAVQKFILVLCVCAVGVPSSVAAESSPYTHLSLFSTLIFGLLKSELGLCQVRPEPNWTFRHDLFDTIQLHFLPLGDIYHPRIKQAIDLVDRSKYHYVEVEVDGSFYPIAAKKQQHMFLAKLLCKTAGFNHAVQVSVANLSGQHRARLSSEHLTASMLNCSLNTGEITLSSCSFSQENKIMFSRVLLLSCEDRSQVNGSRQNACPRGYENNNQQCQRSNCSDYCASCSGHLCRKCMASTSEYPQRRAYLSKGSRVCVTHSNCPPGQFGDMTEMKCKNCSRPCASCLEGFGSEFCTSCFPGFFLSQFKCVNTCPNDTFRTENECVSECGASFFVETSHKIKRCRPCPAGCSQCSSSDHCIGCTPPLFLSKGRCRRSCGKARQRRSDPTIKLWGTSTPLAGQLMLWDGTAWRAVCSPHQADLSSLGSQVCSFLGYCYAIAARATNSTFRVPFSTEIPKQLSAQRTSCSHPKQSIWIHCSGPDQSRRCGDTNATCQLPFSGGIMFLCVRN